MSYPVNLEVWSAFQTTLLTQAKRLCDDVARTYSKDPKELWNSVKGNLSIGLMDIEVDEEIPKYCDFPLGITDGAIRTRCRAPCMLGFSSCPTHIHKQSPPLNPDHPVVDRILDHCNRAYFVDSNGIARDKNGCVKGVYKEDCLYLFEKTTDTASSEE